MPATVAARRNGEGLPILRGSVHAPTMRDMRTARRIFKEREPRDLFYRGATELVALVRRQRASLSLAEAIAVLLQTWNSSYYRYRPFDRTHLSSIETLMAAHAQAATEFASRGLFGLRESDHEAVGRLFDEFDLVLGPVGAAKALHLLAPECFPCGIGRSREANGLSLRRRGRNSERYWRFMKIAREHLSSIYADLGCPDGALKAWNEFNYCEITKQWT